MKKIFFILILLLPLLCNARSIAVFNLQPGAGVPTNDAEGLTSIFDTYFRPENYAIVPRAQVDKVIAEQKFQPYSLTEAQMAQISEILNLSTVVIGNINLIMGEYNVDVMAVDIESGSIIATEGTSFNQGSFRDGMKNLASKMADTLTKDTARQSSGATNTTVYTKEQLKNKGFRFKEDLTTYGIIDGVNGRAAIQAFICGESSKDKFGYTAKKLDKSWYLSGDNNGRLNGLMVVFANGSEKSYPETYIAYVCDGEIAYPMLRLIKNDYRAIGVQETDVSYYEYCTLWEDKKFDGKNRPMFGELMKVYGPQIATQDFLIQGTNGTFDIKMLKDNFDSFMKSNAIISPDVWW